MRIHVYRRVGESPNWHAQAYVGGRRFRFSCDTDNKDTAREVARQRVQELKARHDRGLTGLPEPVRFSGVLQRYEREYLPRLRPTAAKRTRVVLAQAKRFFVDGPLADPLLQHVTAADVQAFLEAKADERVAARTVNLYRANLHRLFRLCVRPWLLIPANPVAATEPLREEPREPVLLTEKQFADMRTASAGHPMLSLFLALAWETGGRSGELLQLEWADVDFERHMVTFRNDPTCGRQTKGRRSRTVPLSDAAVRALKDHAAQFRLLAPPSPYVFKHTRSDRTARPGDRLGTLYPAFKRVARPLGHTKLRPHDLRHSFVTRKLAAGVPAQLVMRYVGHQDLATTLRYTHLVPEHLRAVVERSTATASAGA